MKPTFQLNFENNQSKPAKWKLWAPFLILGFSIATVHAQIYVNSGNNTTGFVNKYAYYPQNATFTSNGTSLVVQGGGVWDTLPITLTDNFQISLEAYNNSNDGDVHILLLNSGTTGGIDIVDSPQGTDTPSINIYSGTDFTNYDQYFFPTLSSTLASAQTTNFQNDLWTPIVITKNGNILTDNVGGQVIQYNISGLNLSSTLQLGLGGYASTTLGGGGTLYYQDLVVTPEPSVSALLALGACILIVGAISKKVKEFGV